MAQVLTMASILAVIGLLGWRYADRSYERRRHAAGSTGRGHAIERHQFERRVYHKASAQDFLRGATDLTFGMVIFGLGFFMLMWVIATA
jgi:hypothetical protein